MEKWWESEKELFAESDGQTWKKIYSRKVDGQWEYLLVITTDDGELVETVSMKDGDVTWEDHW